jgi:hypothetical protein
VKSSTANPSSAPDASASTQRNKNVAPFGMLSPLSVERIVCLFAAWLPSNAPVVPD